MKISRLTARYLPLPQPTSSPTEPGSRPLRNLSMIGHGWDMYQHVVTHVVSCHASNAPNVLYIASTKNVKQFARRLCGRALLRRPRLLLGRTLQHV